MALRGGNRHDDGGSPVPGGSTEDDEVYEIVLSELVKLRQREGITYAKVKSGAHAIKNLPAVDDEFSRMPVKDRPLAALNVIKCTVNHQIRDVTIRRILTRTLNLDECGGNLTAREKSLAYLAIGVSGRNAIRSHVSKAYQDLAASLIASAISPCRTDQSLKPSEMFRQAMSALELRERNDSEGGIPVDSLLPLIRELIQFVIEATDPSEVAYGSQAILDLLPRLEEVVDESDPEQAVLLAFEATHDFYARHFDKTGLTKDQESALLHLDFGTGPTSHLRIARGGGKRHLTRRGPYRRGPRWLRRLADGLSGQGRRGDHIQPAVKLKYWSDRAAFLDTLSRALATAELGNHWQEIFGRGEHRSIEA